jgi:hypothetical protein
MFIENYAPGGTISPISYFAHGGKKCCIKHFGPWRDNFLKIIYFLSFAITKAY